VMGANHPSQRIFDDALFLSISMASVAGPLPPTWDLGATAPLDVGCDLVQLAIRGTDYLSGSLQVDSDYWNSTSNQERAMLLIHEGAHSWFGFDEASVLTGDSALRQFVGLVYTRWSYPKTDALVKELITTRSPLFRSDLSDRALR
jgi:hypothetical protein